MDRMAIRVRIDREVKYLRGRWPLLLVGLLMALYLAYFGWFTLRAYDVFTYQAHDLGIYDQAVWNTAHGRPFRSTLEEPYDTLLGDHVEPILLPIALVYLLWASPKVLLLIQTAALALGALPVYWLARDGLPAALAANRATDRPDAASRQAPAPRWVELSAVALAAVYLLYPPVHSANVFEFHPSALAIPLLLYTLYFLRKRRWVPYFLCLVLTMSTKEVLPLTTLGLGVYVLLVERQRVAGLATMLASALWFVVVIFVVVPHFSPEGESQYFGLFYGWLGTSAEEVVTRIFTEPELVWQRLVEPQSLLYINRLLLPLAYLPLLGLPTLLLIAPALLLNVLSEFSFQRLSLNFFQYAAAIAPFVVVAAIDGTAFLIRHLGPRLGRLRPAEERARDARPLVAGVAVGAMLLLSLAVQRYHGFLPFSQDFYLADDDEKVAAARALVRQVPRDGTVSVDRVFGPYLSHRKTLYLYPSLHDADYAVIDVTNRNAPFPSRDRFEEIQALLTGGRYGVVDGRNGYLLLQRGLDEQALPDAFYDFVREPAPSPGVKTDVVFGDSLQLLGFDLVWERPVRPHARLVLYWKVLRPIDRDLRLFFILTDPSGEPLPGTELEFAATVWYPPSRWKEGEVIRTDTLPWSVEEPGRYGVAVGVVEGPGFWDVGKRLPPSVRSSPWPMPGVHDGSLVWLATLQADGRLATLQPVP